MKDILIVDQNQITLKAYVGLLKSQSGFLNVLSAKNTNEALEIISQRRIHIVITGFYLPEIDSFELVTLVAKQYPDIRIIVMTSNASEMFCAKIKQIPTAVHFDQATDIGLLTKWIFTDLNIDNGGQVRGLSLPSFLQFISQEDRNCTLQISTEGKIGLMSIINGELVAAKVGPLNGEAAALVILSWEDVIIDIDYSLTEIRREITKPLMALLLESRRLVDESSTEPTNLRKHDRFECYVAVDYEIIDWTYQCFLRDISLGGAYIETEQPVKEGQKIVLTLSHPKLESSCSIIGQVVRRDKKGIGVRFEDVGLHQMKVIQALNNDALKLALE